jgi:hypothetical protein
LEDHAKEKDPRRIIQKERILGGSSEEKDPRRIIRVKRILGGSSREIGSLRNAQRRFFSAMF